MIEGLGGFVVGVSMAAVPMAYLIGHNHGQQAIRQTLMTIPKAIGETVNAIKTAIKGVKNEQTTIDKIGRGSVGSVDADSGAEAIHQQE